MLVTGKSAGGTPLTWRQCAWAAVGFAPVGKLAKVAAVEETAARSAVKSVAHADESSSIARSVISASGKPTDISFDGEPQPAMNSRSLPVEPNALWFGGDSRTVPSSLKMRQNLQTVDGGGLLIPIPGCQAAFSYDPTRTAFFPTDAEPIQLIKLPRRRQPFDTGIIPLRRVLSVCPLIRRIWENVGSLRAWQHIIWTFAGCMRAITVGVMLGGRSS